MTDEKFVSLVKEMRSCQELYRKSYSTKTLERKKELEKLVDKEIKAFEQKENESIEGMQLKLF